MKTHSRRFVLGLTLLVLFVCQNSAASDPDPRFTVTIEKTHNAPFGQIEDVKIYLDNSVDPGYGMRGFDFLIEFDPSVLAFNSAEPGQLITDCGWEYFTYRHGASGNCGSIACPTGKLRLVAVAETNNGNNHPDCFGETPGVNGVLAIIHFLVSNDYTVECQFVPIRFVWYDCGDNAISSISGDSLFISNHIYDLNGNDIANPNSSYPTFYGANWTCDTLVADSLPTALRCVNFYNGGVDIVCSEIIDDRGDINLNGLPFEVADYDLFLAYFKYGLGVFSINAAGQIAASDINRDGQTLKLEDLIQLRAISFGEMNSDSTIDSTVLVGALIVQDFETKTIAIAHNSLTELIWLRLNGEIIPLNTNNDFSVSYYFGGGDTRVLIENFQDSTIHDLALVFNYSGEGIIGEIQSTNVEGFEIETYLDQCLLDEYCYGYELSKIGDIDLNGITCEADDMSLFSHFLVFGESVLVFYPTIQYGNMNLNHDGEIGGIADFVKLGRSITSDEPCSAYVDSTSPNISTFTQFIDPARSFGGHIDVNTIDTLGAVQLKFAGEIEPSTSNPDMSVAYNKGGGQTTILVTFNLDHSLNTSFILQRKLIDYAGVGDLIFAQTASYTGVKINSEIDFASEIGEENQNLLPGQFALHQNFPNPFNNSTVISFDIPRAGNVELEIINLLGQRVYRFEKRYSAGSHAISWDGADNAGKTVGSGVYYYRIIAGDFIESKKMILLK